MTNHRELEVASSVRCSDADRHDASVRLVRAHHEGRLSAELYEKRAEAARRATTESELHDLLRDLPSGKNALGRVVETLKSDAAHAHTMFHVWVGVTTTLLIAISWLLPVAVVGWTAAATGAWAASEVIGSIVGGIVFLANAMLLWVYIGEVKCG